MLAEYILCNEEIGVYSHATTPERSITTMFNELPTCILSDLLSSWLHIRDIARLDSASCSCYARKEFLQVCQQKEFSFLHTSKVRHHLLMQWLIVRRFRVKTIGFNDVTNLSLFAKVLPITGMQLRSVVISRLRDSAYVAAAISIIAQYCLNIEKQRFYACIVDISFLELLATKPTLRTITIDACNIVKSYSLPTEVSVNRCVQNIYLRSVPRIGEAHQHFENLFQMFPALLVLHLNCPNLSNHDMVQIVACCPHINTYTLQNCHSLTESSFQMATTRWALKKFAVRGCAACTDALLQSIAKSGCFATLESFLFRSTNTFSIHGLEMFLRCCPRLTAVTFGFYPFNRSEFMSRTNHTGKIFIEFIAPRLGNILVLVLEQSLCYDDVLEAVGNYCKRLEVLDLADDTKGFFSNTGRGLIHALIHCAHLRTLVVSKDIKMDLFNSHLMLRALQCFRPHLQLTCIESC